MLNVLFAQTIVLSNKGAAANDFLTHDRAHNSSRNQPVLIVVHLVVYCIAVHLAIHSLAFLLAHDSTVHLTIHGIAVLLAHDRHWMQHRRLRVSSFPYYCAATLHLNLLAADKSSINSLLYSFQNPSTFGMYLCLLLLWPSLSESRNNV